ncbi:hypothetical protein GWI33_019954 [Rhynchophorus ferrugineus]|uniref:Ionotropic receptor 75a N-terminal domain-containing protein n=1 Tax=Rhynchophorus ferrugineus TaxID=354439 RepID=A0A834HSG9_RHYFE|nr:hypothetical protein GWI33_019954 [Rhynchophorus ferrugineus]
MFSLMICGSENKIVLNRLEIKQITRYLNEKYILVSNSIIKPNASNPIPQICYKRVGVVLDGDCKGASHVLYQCGLDKNFDLKYHWLIFTSHSNYSVLFNGVNINIDVNIRVAYPALASLGIDAEFIIDDVYNPAFNRGGTLIKEVVGQYDGSKYQVKQQTNKFWDRRNLTGITFRTMTVFHEGNWNGTPEEYLESNEHKEKNTYSRFHGRLMSYCTKHYGYRLNISWLTDYGYKSINGVMVGLSGELQKGTIDFGLSALSARMDRVRAMTLGRHTWKLRSAFIFKNPKSKNSFELFIRPMTFKVWTVLVLSLLLAIFITRTCSTFDYSVNDTSWTVSCLSVIASLSQQGLLIVPRRTPARICVLSTLLLTTMVYLFYSGCLVSSLLNVPLLTVKTIQDLLDLDLKIALENVTLNKEYFKFADDDASKEMYRRWIHGRENSAYMNPTDGLELAKAGTLAFHVEIDKAYTFLRENCDDEEVCEFKEVQLFRPRNMYATYPKHSPFRDMIDVCLQRIAEAGVLEKEYQFWRATKPICVYRYHLNMGMAEFYPVLIFVPLGILMSLLILLIEIIIYRYNIRYLIFVN